MLENHIFPPTWADQAFTREQHSPVCGPTVEIVDLSKTALDALGSMKGLMDTCVLTEAKNRVNNDVVHAFEQRSVKRVFRKRQTTLRAEV